MLKKFFFNLLTSFMGAWIAIVVLGVVVVVVAVSLIGKMAFNSGMPQEVSKHSILKLELKGTIEETEKSREFDLQQLMQGDVERPQTLNSIVQALGDAAENDNIDALYIDCQGVSASPATLNALRDAVVNFKKSADKKPVIAYGNSMTQADYFVASVADSIFVNPAGNMVLSGIGGAVPYYKGLLDKVGVQFQVAKVGTFKSAVEPYTMEQMSAPARAQLDTLYGVMWNYMRDKMAESRKIQPAAIDSLVNNVSLFLPLDLMVQNKLIDKCVYGRYITDLFANITGVDKEKLNFVSPALLASQSNWNTQYSADKQIAVLYACGEISEAPGAGINCEELVPVINQLADDESVKGMVFRVNSPGGSVFGSKQIAEALEYFKSKGKPYVVSMGDYAASGGYWISAYADRIFADPLTITGSIGIFGLFPNIQGLTEKLGVNTQVVSTNPNGTILIPLKALNEVQMEKAQQYIQVGYDEFIARVATGRKMSEARVREIAEGRVWNAITAQKIGLVDELGSVQDAIAYMGKKLGNADDFTVTYYPEYTPGFWDMIPMGTDNLMQIRHFIGKYGSELSPEAISQVYMLLHRRNAMALMPKIIFN